MNKVDPFLADLMEQLESAMALDKENKTLSKAKLEVIGHAHEMVDNLENEQKEAEEAATKEAEERVL